MNPLPLCNLTVCATLSVVLTACGSQSSNCPASEDFSSFARTRLDNCLRGRGQCYPDVAVLLDNLEPVQGLRERRECATNVELVDEVEAEFGYTAIFRCAVGVLTGEYRVFVSLTPRNDGYCYRVTSNYFRTHLDYPIGSVTRGVVEG